MKTLKVELNYLLPKKIKNLVRLGRDNDGGYLVCKDTLNKCKNLITLGVGDDISFERDFDRLVKPKNIHLYDYTVSYMLFFKIILKYSRRFLTFRTNFFRITDSVNNLFNFQKFIKQQNVKLFKEKVVATIKEKNDINLEKIFFRLKSENNNFLKIDIEGSEYQIIDKIVKFQSSIEMLIIEFHWINKNKSLFENSIKRLKENFAIIHIHANNYIEPKDSDYFFDVVEISFVKKTNLVNYENDFNYKFPLENLDQECFKHHPKIEFSFSK